MMYHLKNKFSVLGLGTTLCVVALMAGCGGGGSSPSVPQVPSPFDASYNATYTPADVIPADGQAPTGALTITNGRASVQTTFFLQKSVVDAVQVAVNKGLTDAGFARAIPNNQVPSSIAFTGSGQVDGSGKLVLTARETVDICGAATLTIDPTFTSNGAAFTGAGSYNITFPNNLTIELNGKRPVAGTCNNLPLRSGTVTFTR